MNFFVSIFSVSFIHMVSHNLLSYALLYRTALLYCSHCTTVLWCAVQCIVLYSHAVSRAKLWSGQRSDSVFFQVEKIIYTTAISTISLWRQYRNSRIWKNSTMKKFSSSFIKKCRSVTDSIPLFYGAFIHLLSGFCVLYVSPACVSFATVDASNGHSLYNVNKVIYWRLLNNIFGWIVVTMWSSMVMWSKFITTLKFSIKFFTMFLFFDYILINFLTRQVRIFLPLHF